MSTSRVPFPEYGIFHYNPGLDAEYEQRRQSLATKNLAVFFAVTLGVTLANNYRIKRKQMKEAQNEHELLIALGIPKKSLPAGWDNKAPLIRTKSWLKRQALFDKFVKQGKLNALPKSSFTAWSNKMLVKVAKQHMNVAPSRERRSSRSSRGSKKALTVAEVLAKQEKSKKWKTRRKRTLQALALLALLYGGHQHMKEKKFLKKGTHEDLGISGPKGDYDVAGEFVGKKTEEGGGWLDDLPEFEDLTKKEWQTRKTLAQKVDKALIPNSVQKEALLLSLAGQKGQTSNIEVMRNISKLKGREKKESADAFFEARKAGMQELHKTPIRKKSKYKRRTRNSRRRTRNSRRRK